MKTFNVFLNEMLLNIGNPVIESRKGIVANVKGCKLQVVEAHLNRHMVLSHSEHLN